MYRESKVMDKKMIKQIEKIIWARSKHNFYIRIIGDKLIKLLTNKQILENFKCLLIDIFSKSDKFGSPKKITDDLILEIIKQTLFIIEWDMSEDYMFDEMTLDFEWPEKNIIEQLLQATGLKYDKKMNKYAHPVFVDNVNYIYYYRK